MFCRKRINVPADTVVITAPKNSSFLGRLGDFDPVTARRQSLPAGVSSHDTVHAPRDCCNAALGGMCLQLPRARGSVRRRDDLLSSLRSTAAGGDDESTGRVHGRAHPVPYAPHAPCERRGLCISASGDGRADRRLAGVGTVAAATVVARATGDGGKASGPEHSRWRFPVRKPGGSNFPGPRGKAAEIERLFPELPPLPAEPIAVTGAEWSAIYLGRLAADRRRQQPSASASRHRRGSRPRQHDAGQCLSQSDGQLSDAAVEQRQHAGGRRLRRGPDDQDRRKAPLAKGRGRDGFAQRRTCLAPGAKRSGHPGPQRLLRRPRGARRRSG